jgi:hypothetical protein
MRIYISLVTLLWNMVAYSAETYHVDLTIDAYSAPVSIHAFTSDWHDDLKSGDNAFLHGLAELSRENEQRKISLLWRYDYLLDFNEQTAQLYHRYANNNNPTANSSYTLAIEAKYSESYGIQWLQKFHFRPNIELGLGLSLLKGYKITDGQLNGQSLFKQAGFDVTDIQQANLDVNYYYDQPHLHEDQLDWYPRNPSALGFSVNTVVKWQISPQLMFNAQINDLYGQLYWQDIPTTQYNVSCQCSTFQHNIEGQLAIADKYTQHLSPHSIIQLIYSSPQSWLAELNTTTDKQMTLVQGAWGYQHSTWQSLLLIEPQTRAVGVELRHPNWHFRWLTDDLNTNKAHRMGLSLGVNQQW